MNVARYWRTEKTRYGLVGETCRVCGKPIFPPRDLCPHCTEAGQDLRTFGGKGEVYSFAHVADAPAGYTEYQPYTMALILLTFLAGLIPIVGNLICNGVLTLVGLSVSPLAVSYTHLRAHETVLDLVCRLLLDKKKLE